ncbi:TPA: conjugative transfer relaxase/helicase TraI [Legionella pneumophila]|jgi:conjugative transfer relaxase protein TraI|nr:conjugative transfer relaxase/helicase TraI [Legionella pneumophila]MDW8922317.1 conjugative transfer relaxase/helicase TraI [Legionella pneumophila]HAU1484343.1 conjugative transfer relaxase/helicase TraI [Legionella pneumophila]HAU1500064.1 conjugative transfer relaxase/helicase TraI [Legionella pneumophila]HAU1519214.1 conjugative transfer relaxase/helicase TraI [Legionella pneumophila]
MLSLRVKPIKMPGYYFDKENYYFSNQLTTEWVGLSAERQNLSGEVNVLSLEAVVRGALPSGDVIGLKTQSGEIKHRGGYDLTFSAPKSVSYLGLVCGHKEFIDLHLNAVKTVLKLIEKEAAEARKSGKEGMEYEKTGNLCFATILHDTSREQDPQLHVHALLMNFTERLDGKWRALASDISRNHGTMEWIMDNQILLGLVYRSEMALGLKEMGLEIEHTGDAHGLFEIKHFDKTLLERMSKRRTQVEEHIKWMHSNSLKAYDRATLDSRKSKEVISPEELRIRWKAESEALGINPVTYLATLKDKTKESHTPKEAMSNNQELDRSVLDAIAHLEEKKLTFTYQEVLQTSLYFSLGEQGFEALMSRIDQEIDAQNLIALNTENSSFTTSKLINKEQELIKKIVNFTHQKKGIERNMDKVCKLTDNESIQKAVTQALFNKDGVVRIKQQSATSRELLSTLIDYSQDSKKIRILCPSAFSANTINKDMAKSAPTLWQWILSIGKQDLCETVAGFNYRHGLEHKLPFFHSKKEREVLIVDEAQRLAPDEMNTLLSIADKRCAKVILLEKSQSLSGFKSDIPDLLDKACIKSFEVDDRKVPATSINLIEAQTVEGRILKTAQMYCNLPVIQRKNTKVFTVSKLEAKEVNEAIRTQLKEQGGISSDEKTINTLTRIPLTLSEKKLAKSYQSNWILIHNTRTESKKFTVLGINEKDNQLIVRNSNGARSLLAAKNITDSMQIYEQTPLSVGIGDQLVATASLSFEGLKIGNQYEVTAFTRHGIKIRDGKRSIHLITSNEKHFPLSHAYAKTMYSDDLKPVKQSIMTLPAYALKQNTMSLLCESSKENVMIITDNVDKANRFAMKSATKSSAISLTLDAAKTNHGAQIIDHRTTSDLLSSLEQALTLLTAKKPQKSDAEKALNFAIAHLSEREAAFTRSDLLKVAVHQAIGKAGLNEIDNVLGNAINSGDLISGGNEFLTTKEAVAFEESIIKNVKAGINILKPLMSSDEARKQLELTELTKGQKEACELITTTSDQFIMIQGYAGTGKTTMTRSAIDTIKHAQSITHEEVELIAVAPTHQAVKEMRALGIEAQTLKSFLIEQEQESTLSKKTLVLLDESSMVSNRDCANLMQKIHHSGARCAMLGDISQHQSIESGKPSKILIQEGSIRVACMDDLVRQQVIEYKKAIETLIAGDIDKALAQLANQPLDSITRTKADSPYHGITSSIIETGDLTKDYLQLESTQQQSIDPFQEELKQKKPIEMAIGDYLSRTPSCRDNTIVIIHENKKREVANGLIRDALMKESTLGSENKEFPRLLSTNYTTAELYYCETYRDCLKKQEEYFLKKGEHYFKVVSVDESAKVVVLNDVKGNKCLFVPEKENKDWKIELFQSMPGRVSVGEKIHFKKSDKTLGRFANERVQVTEVNNESFTVKDSSGVEHVLQKELMSDSHWDYSYTATSYSIQGASSPFVIGVAETKNAQVNHLRSFYIMVTRGSLHAMIYTDDHKKLQKQLRVTPEKTSALESLNHLNVQTKPPIPNAPSTSLKAAQSMPIMKNQEPRYDANMLSQHLSEQAELVIESLLGQPNQALSSKTEYRYGTHGSLSLCLSGEKRGIWHNFETKEKGNMLHLIQKTLNLNFKESLEYAAKLTGDDLKERIKIASKNPNNLQVKDTDKKRKTSDYGLQLVRESKPISGTIAERYLKEIRKIHNVSGENIRFHPNVYTKDTEEVRYRPALLNIARDKDNKVACVEVVYLDNETANKAIMKIKPKKSYGSKAGVGVLLSEGKGHESVTYITEGVETGLSVRDAVQNERVIATLGKENFVNIDMALLTDKIVICMDNDGKPIKEDKVIIQTIERLKQHGKTVEIAIPLHQKDFNDVNKSSGLQGVVDILNKATNVDKFIGCPNKIDMNQDQIKKCLESISRQMNLELPENKNNPIEKLKTLQREEMEIY